MPQSHIPVQKRAPIKRLVAIGCAVTLSFLAICGFVIAGMADRDYEQARRSSENLVATLSANIAGTIDALDLSLQGVQEGLKLPDLDRIDPAIRNMIMYDRSATSDDVGSILALDRDGNVTSESRSLTPRKDNFAARDFFQHHRDNADTGAYISRPHVTRQGVHVLTISRRINDFDGNFNGVVVAALKLSYFHNLLKGIRIGAEDSLTINAADGTTLMRMPFDIAMVGGDLSRGRIFSELKKSPVGSFETFAASDGVRRLTAYQKAGNWPLIASAGRSVTEIYAPWKHEALMIGAIVFVLCAFNVALVAFLAFSLQRRAAAEQELAIIATTDGLTGLCNRRRFDELLESEWRRAQRSKSSIALLMIDVDHFKYYNDEHGHLTGDAVLAAIARCIAGSTRRAGDVAARFGGEEFAVLLPATSLQDAADLAERIRGAVFALPASTKGILTTPTVSVGVAAAFPRPGTQPADMVEAADKALYQAKASGRNRSVKAPVLGASKSKLAA
jgi:diguanylate cyclase (GGDEF)-like protein